MRGDIALFLGLVIVIGGGIVVAVVFALGGDGSEVSDTGACDNPLAPLGESDISHTGFQVQDEGLARAAQAASVGNLEAAESAFFGDVHNFTHNIDQPLREVDQELAKELCEKTIEMEEELAIGRRVSIIAGLAARLRELMRDAAETLGYARPGG